MRAEITRNEGPSPGSRVVRLIEDTQNTWRNTQIVITPARSRIIKVTAEIKFDTPGRQAGLMVLAGTTDRFSGNLDPSTRRVATHTLGGGVVVDCTAVTLGNDWWRVELTGYLSEKTAQEPAFLFVALTKDGVKKEDYQGDGKSSISVGKVTISQQAA